MNNTEARQILIDYNAWRRGDGDMPKPKDIGVAIDAAITALTASQAVEPVPNALENIASYLGLGGFNGATPEQLEGRIKAEFDRISALAKPLSDEKIMDIACKSSLQDQLWLTNTDEIADVISFVRAIEAAHGIKETS